MNTTLPGPQQELQQLLGRLLWAAPFIPDFKEGVQPIEALLSPKGGGEWTLQRANALNDLLRAIEAQLTLTIANLHAALEALMCRMGS